MGRDRRDSLSSDDSLSKSDSLSSSEERQDNRNDRNNRQRSSSESISSDDKNKSKKDKKSKSSKDSKKDKEKEKKKDEKSKKGKKKISKEDKKDKKKKHKSGKDKKSKKEKKEKKSKKDSKKYVQQPTSKASKRFGKYGIIKQILSLIEYKEHAYEKRDEFQQWLADVKKLNIEALTQNEERKLFDDFIEDYNTASMPEQKYYDLGLWEQYLQAKQIGKKIKTNEDVGLDDEALKKLEREKQRQAFETQATAAALNTIYTQGNMASEIQETEAKRALMQQSYKIGDIEKALEIQKELVPEKKKPGQQV